MSYNDIDGKTAWQPWQPNDQEPWDIKRAAHLVRRSGFGATMDELQSMVRAGVSQSIDQLFSMTDRQAFDESLAPMERVLASSQDPRQLGTWWLLRMLQTPCQLLEKTTLFWHGHFATGAEKVANSRAMLTQNRLLRQHALGSFKPMVHGISQDVAMLIYLDSQDNRKTRPNENYARELMELFCLGTGNYSEQDIKQIARCFTGWSVRRGQFRFDKHQHDEGLKSFLGQSGNFGGRQAVDIVLQQDAAPKFIARKLVRYFVADELNWNADLMEPLEKQLRDTDFDIGQTVRTILESRLFFSKHAIGQKVRGPVELAIGLLRGLNAKTNMNLLANKLESVGQLPLFPPNVKGWEGGRQWVNASTYFGRANLIRDLVTQTDDQFADGSVASAIKASSRNTQQWVRRLIDTWVAVPIGPETEKHLMELATQQRRSLGGCVKDVICALGALPEFQLS